MKPIARFSPFPFLAVFSLSCDIQRTSAPPPGSTLSFDRSAAPGLDQACRDKPGLGLARRPNAPLELVCALTLPSGSSNILNGTKLWAEGGRLYLTELANGSVYIWDAVSHDYVGRVGGFVGSTGVAATSGPNSIVLTGDGHAWVSDGISAVRVVDLSSRSIVATISTAIAACGTTCQRTNEITFDPEHRIVFVQNPSPMSGGAAIDTYGTFISADWPYPVLGTIAFPDRRGQEAPLWDPEQHRILTAVSGRLVGTTVFHQYVAVIDPTVRTIEHAYNIDCTTLGLTGAGGARLFGINDPALGPDEHMVIPGCGHAIIMDARSGDILAVRRQIGGGNETWYNPGDGNFYVTGIDSTRTAPVNSLGVIDARSAAFLQGVPAVAATNPAAAAENNQVFAVVPAAAVTAPPTACNRFGFQSSGCILVFAHVPGEDHNH